MKYFREKINKKQNFMKSHNPCPISLQAVSDVKNKFCLFFFLLSSLIKYCFLAFYSLEFIFIFF